MDERTTNPTHAPRSGPPDEGDVLEAVQRAHDAAAAAASLAFRSVEAAERLADAAERIASALERIASK